MTRDRLPIDAHRTLDRDDHKVATLTLDRGMVSRDRGVASQIKFEHFVTADARDGPVEDDVASFVAARADGEDRREDSFDDGDS